jgi:hypothetical protein
MSSREQTSSDHPFIEDPRDLQVMDTLSLGLIGNSEADLHHPSRMLPESGRNLFHLME